MKLALLQINDGEEIFLIDAVAIPEPEHLCSFLYSNSVTKIFHSCKEDLEAIYSWTNKKMANIFDTQIANSFLNGDFSISYQNLVERDLGIFLEKNETRSNWLRRPLTDSQLKYAALDVEYLIYLYREQIYNLSNSNKLTWFYEEIEKTITSTFDDVKDNSQLSRVISKSEESNILFEMNALIEGIARQEKINSTLFFSKKAQKEFLRLVLNIGIKEACKELTLWRRKLIEKKLVELLR